MDKSDMIENVVDKQANEFTAMSIANDVREFYGVIIDWHIAAIALDQMMNRCYKVTVSRINSSGMTIYKRR